MSQANEVQGSLNSFLLLLQPTKHTRLSGKHSIFSSVGVGPRPNIFNCTAINVMAATNSLFFFFVDDMSENAVSQSPK